jgi:hypothetical protein
MQPFFVFPFSEDLDDKHEYGVKEEDKGDKGQTIVASLVNNLEKEVAFKKQSCQ